MRTSVIATLAISFVVTACGGGAASTSQPTTAPPIAASALDGLLLAAENINSVMGGTAMKVSSPLTEMVDHANLMPNVNCLGIWQVGEKAVYDGSGWTAIRGQVLRQPIAGDWDDVVVQAVVSFPSPDAAQKFFAASTDRWSKCTHHRVNMTVNGQLTTWQFGDLTRSDTELTMHVTRGGGERSCQHALSISNNVVVDVTACTAAAGDQGATIVNKIESGMPH
jgi:hypothetical protein